MAYNVKEIRIFVEGINMSKSIAQECKEWATAVFCLIKWTRLSLHIQSDIIA
jgi:hypothetical protein